MSLTRPRSCVIRVKPDGLVKIFNRFSCVRQILLPTKYITLQIDRYASSLVVPRFAVGLLDGLPNRADKMFLPRPRLRPASQKHLPHLFRFYKFLQSAVRHINKL